VGGGRPLRPALGAGWKPLVETVMTAGGNRPARDAERKGLQQPACGYKVDPGLLETLQ